MCRGFQIGWVFLGQGWGAIDLGEDEEGFIQVAGKAHVGEGGWVRALGFCVQGVNNWLGSTSMEV